MATMYEMFNLLISCNRSQSFFATEFMSEAENFKHEKIYIAPRSPHLCQGCGIAVFEINTGGAKQQPIPYHTYHQPRSLHSLPG